MGKKPIYIKVIDVSALSEVNEDEWSAVILIHTTEMNKVQSDVKAYLDKAHDLNKVIIITTSGPGNWKTDKYDVDIITSASKKKELPSLISTILTKLDVILKTETM